MSKDKIELLRSQVRGVYANGRMDSLKLVEFNNKADALVKDALGEWIESVKQEDTQTIIISFGSAHAEKQQCPDFVKGFNGKVAILNIDDVAFKDETGKVENNISIEYIPECITSNETKESYTALTKAIKDWVHSGKKVIVMNHISPVDHNRFKEITDPHLDNLGDNFCYVASYHQHQPVVVCSRNFFEKNDEAQVQFVPDLWKKEWNLSQDQFDALSKKYENSEYGDFYRNIDELRPEHLFRAYAKQHREEQVIDVKQKEENHSTSPSQKQTEKRKPQEENINSAERKIDAALDDLRQNIGGIDQHHSTKAFKIANELLDDLQALKTQYLDDFRLMDKKLSDLSEEFTNKCKTLINKARPILEKDLGWGDYLTNLLRTIANAVLWTVTFGQKNTFFTPAGAESLKAVQDFEDKLKP